MKTKHATKFPIVFDKGGIIVKIYRMNEEKPRYVVSYHLGGKRVRRTFTGLSKAKVEAQTALTKLLNGEAEVLRLTGKDRAVYVHSLDRLSELTPRPSLFEATEEYARAKALLPEGVSMWEVVKEWTHLHRFPERTTSEVLEEMIAAKERAGLTEVYIKDLHRLKRFTESFNTQIINVKSIEIEAFLLSLKRAPRTQNNVRNLIGTLFSFAEKRGYLPKGHDILSGVEKVKDIGGEIEIFTPKELANLFEHVREEMTPYLAIAAFAGLRKAELERLDWSEINLEEGFIVVTAAKAKTASRRLVPLTDNLYEWLIPYKRSSGMVVPFANVSKQLSQVLANDSGIKWKRNGLRHSYISFRLAKVKNVNQVAFEAGNSPSMIFKHYRELVTERQSTAWFSIVPPEQEKVLNSAECKVAA
jgi:integrase